MDNNSSQETGKQKLRVILLTHGGAEMLLEKLLALDNIYLAGVFVETDITPRRSFKEKIKRSIRYDGYWATIKKFAGAFNRSGNDDEGKSGQDKFRGFAEKHGVSIHFVNNYHNEEAIKLMRDSQADLGIIYGTNIIKESVFGIPRFGSINLHQGLAPLYRGGPTVFWELFNDEKEIGLTVHYVAAKVDTGDIILQETIPLEYDFKYGVRFEDFLDEFRAALKEPSAKLVAEAVRQIAEGNAPRRQQDTSIGTRYRLPIKKEKDELRRRLKKRNDSNKR